jgi:hypothetical protein
MGIIRLFPRIVVVRPAQRELDEFIHILEAEGMARRPRSPSTG